MGLIIGQGTKSGGGGGDVRLESNHNATLTTNGTHVVTPNEGYDGMRKATINVDVEAADPTDKALVNNATQYGLSHNLYKVMEQVKADPRTSGYAAIMLCQYYKGYNSLSLEGGADAFLTSDGDFYQGNAVHYWHDANDEYFDRWVAMLFSSESGSYTCSNANICPRAALIDGTMGNITLAATSMRFAWIDVTEGSSWGYLTHTSYAHTNSWGRNTILRGMRNTQNISSNYSINLGNAFSACIGLKKISKATICDSSNTCSHIKFENLEEVAGGLFRQNGAATALVYVDAPMLTSAASIITTVSASGLFATNLRWLKLPKCTNLPTFTTNSNSAIGWASLIHFELGQGFNSNLNLKACSFANCLLSDANNLVDDLQAHPTWSNLDQWLFNFEHLIVDKLADLSGQTAKTITLAAAPYAAITESIRQKMSAKNWNLASA